MHVHLGNDWDQVLESEFTKPYFLKLKEFVDKEYQTKTIYPARANIFEALQQTSYTKTKVVILGQDPYHGAGQAHGLAFSVPVGVASPPSLKNIFKELASDLKAKTPNNGCLLFWAEQGVLLLNTTLTVRAGEATSHQKQGWEEFTTAVLAQLNNKRTPLVFLLWGNHAQNKGKVVTNPQHLVLKTVHPSPLSAYRGYFGSAHFSQANEFLEKTGQEPIVWQIPDIPIEN